VPTSTATTSSNTSCSTEKRSEEASSPVSHHYFAYVTGAPLYAMMWDRYGEYVVERTIEIAFGQAHRGRIGPCDANTTHTWTLCSDCSHSVRRLLISTRRVDMTWCCFHDICCWLYRSCALFFPTLNGPSLGAHASVPKRFAEDVTQTQNE